MADEGAPSGSALELFGRLTADDVEALFSMGAERRLHPGDVVVVADSAPTALFVVLDGELAVLSATEPQELVNTVRAGEVLGEIAYFDGAKSSMTVAALGACTVLELPMDRIGGPP